MLFKWGLLIMKKFISELIHNSQLRLVWYKLQLQECYQANEIYPDWYKEWLRELKNSETIWSKKLQEESYWININ